MYELGVVYRNIQRADRAVADQLAALGSATVHEAMGRVGLMKPYMRPIQQDVNVSGTAVTVLLQPGDNWMMHVAAEQIQPGDLVVATVTADCSDGYFGDLLATSFQARGARQQAHARRVRSPAQAILLRQCVPADADTDRPRRRSLPSTPRSDRSGRCRANKTWFAAASSRFR